MIFFEVKMRIRKQENALTIFDLMQFPAWEYALDEEDVPGQNEDKLMQPLLPYDLHPVIVTDQGHVPFCYGVFRPDEATISENYKRLSYEAEKIFPISFMADIWVSNSVNEGVLKGFLFFEQDLKNFFKLKLSDIKYVK
jgi:hypothetical protein